MTTLLKADKAKKINTEKLCSLAVTSMVTELELSPKPGLVDKLDNGAHKDMNAETFYSSVQAIKPFFQEILLATPLNAASREVLPQIRPAGIKAEKAMFQATKNINTHKGQIFSLGTCLAASYRILSLPETTGFSRNSGNEILMEAGKICQGMSKELSQKAKPGSNGEKLYRKEGYKGIRGEAESGFASVRLKALPHLKMLLDTGCSYEDAALETLLLLFSFVEDSNVLHRCGIGGLTMMRRLSTSFLEEGGIRQKGSVYKLQGMNAMFITMNISPGGCADLLALTLFIHSIENSLEL